MDVIISIHFELMSWEIMRTALAFDILLGVQMNSRCEISFAACPTVVVVGIGQSIQFWHAFLFNFIGI